MSTDEEINAAYRNSLVALLKEAGCKGDRPAQQRIKLMIELHDKGLPIRKIMGRGAVENTG